MNYVPLIPVLYAISELFTQTMEAGTNPFVWDASSSYIKSGVLSLTYKQNGSEMVVENASQPFEIKFAQSAPINRTMLALEIKPGTDLAYYQIQVGGEQMGPAV